MHICVRLMRSLLQRRPAFLCSPSALRLLFESMLCEQVDGPIQVLSVGHYTRSREQAPDLNHYCILRTDRGNKVFQYTLMCVCMNVKEKRTVYC